MKKIKTRFFVERDFDAGDVSLTMYGEPAEFGVLGEAWHETLKAAVAGLRATRPNSRYWQSIGSNYVGFPIVYNYRHVLELYLKGVLIEAEPALTLDGQPPIPDNVFRSHSFEKLRPEVERVFAALGISFDFGIDGFRTRDDFRSMLTALDQIEVRYPIDTSRKPAMGDRWLRFNVFEFAEKMDAILDILRWYPSVISEMVDARQEAAYEAQQEAWANADFEPPDYD